MNYLKTIITCHSLDDNELFKVAKENKINDINRCKKLLNILKDADGLDRVRGTNSPINLKYLRTNTSKKLLIFAYQFYYNYERCLENRIPFINKNDCKKYVTKKYSGKIRKIVFDQIDLFYEIQNLDLNFTKHNYQIGDDVILSNNHFLHGIGKNEKALDFIANTGILSKESTGDFGNHAFQFVVGLWKVKETIPLKDYIRNYSGIIARYNDTCEQIPYGKLDEFVYKMKSIDHWLWTAESSMEIRFMPSLAKDVNQIGFILNMTSSIAKELLKNDINDKNYDKKISNYFLRKELRGKTFNNKENTFLERASYVIFGINKCFIEGIIVGRQVEKNKEMLYMLKEKFPNVYICNLEGKVIFI